MSNIHSAARVALRVIENRNREATEALERGDRDGVAMIQATLSSQLITLLAPYADRMPFPLPHTLIVLSNGSTLRTTQNTPGDIAGLINAGEAEVYQVTDLNDGLTHHLRVSAILDFYEVTS